MQMTLAMIHTFPHARMIECEHSGLPSNADANRNKPATVFMSRDCSDQTKSSNHTPPLSLRSGKYLVATAHLKPSRGNTISHLALFRHLSTAGSKSSTSDVSSSRLLDVTAPIINVKPTF